LKIALFLPNWVGDAAMSTPALRAFRNQFKNDTITGIMRPAIRQVYDGADWFDDIMVYDIRPGTVGMTRSELVRSMRTHGFDLSLLFTNSFGTALLAALGGAKRRIGYARDGRSLLLTERLPVRMKGLRPLPYPAVDSYLALAYALGCPEETYRLELSTTEHDERAADRVWKRAGFGAADRVVVCNSSGAFGAAKLWPDEYFAALAKRLADEAGCRVLFVCGPSERERIHRLVGSLDDPRITDAGSEPPSIGLTKACIRRSALLVTTDSGPRHFGAAFGIPVVALFGPTHIAWSDTHYPLEVRLQREVDCGPCQQRTCPLHHHRCMRELDVDTVFREATHLLGAWRPA